MNRTLRLGRSLEISLPGNPTTGYEWKCCISNPSVVSVYGKYIPPDIQLPGRGGDYTFDIIATKRGTSTLTFQYLRPWENISIDTRVYNITVV